MHGESPAVTEDSAMAKAPAGTTEDPAMMEEVGSEDELEDITPVTEEIWTPPYHVPESTWSIPGPVGPRPDTSLHLLSALREMVFSGTLDVCRAFFSDPKVDAVGEAAPANSTSLRGGRAGGDVDPVETPDLVTEDDPRSQASHPSDGLLTGRRREPSEARFRQKIDENLKKVLEEVREHPHQPAVQPAVSDDEAWGNWRASPDLRRPVTPPRRPVTPPKQPPRQKAKVELSPVLQPPMPVPAEAPSLSAPVEAPPLGVPLPIQPCCRLLRGGARCPERQPDSHQCSGDCGS